MIEEPGRVIAVEPGAVWVETQRSSTCSGCSVRSGCGKGLADRLGIRERRGLVRASSDLHLDVGDAVVIGIREHALLKGAFLVYLFPLLTLFASAVAASELSLAEPYIILASVIGFVIACSTVRKHSRQTADDPALQPIVLRALLTAAPA